MIISRRKHQHAIDVQPETKKAANDTVMTLNSLRTATNPYLSSNRPPAHGDPRNCRRLPSRLPNSIPLLLPPQTPIFLAVALGALGLIFAENQGFELVRTLLANILKDRHKPLLFSA
jgi:hypothetical protein